MAFQVRYLALFLLLPVIDGFEWFSMESLLKNLMNFLMMLTVILPSMLMILLSILNVIRHLICGNNQNWLLNLNLIYETLWTGDGKTQLVSFDRSNNTVVTDRKMDGSVLK